MCHSWILKFQCNCLTILTFSCLQLIDIDECLSSPCNHTCTNTAGGFQCSCNDGYELDDDRRTCNGVLCGM